MRMEFLVNFDFQIPLPPYSEAWKNFERSDFPPLGCDTKHEAVTEYLAAWEKRAIALGARKVELGDLSSNEFSTYSEELEYWNVLGINMGKSRRAGGGGLWTDGWIMQFTTVNDAESHKTPSGFFRSVSAFCDEFNTAARR